MAIYTADQIADTIIVAARCSEIEITNLKLQKLLYYTQAWNLVLREEPLFHEEFEAWIHGPVVPSIFRRFKAYRWNPILEEVSSADGEALVHVAKVLKVYGNATANQLERLTHSESPWIDARGDTPPTAPSNAVISKESMRVFYSEKRNGSRKRA